MATIWRGRETARPRLALGGWKKGGGSLKKQIQGRHAGPRRKRAARMVTGSGADMVIANGDAYHVIHKIMQGKPYGTLFLEDKKDEFYVLYNLEHMV